MLSAGLKGWTAVRSPGKKTSIALAAAGLAEKPPAVQHDTPKKLGYTMPGDSQHLASIHVCIIAVIAVSAKKGASQ